MPGRAGLLRKLSGYAPLNGREEAALRELLDRAREVPADIEFLREGEAGKKAYVVVDGWAYGYKSLPDGRRQIISFQLPGDFAGLRAMLLQTSDHSCSTLTPCRLAVLERSRLERLFADFPALGAAVLRAVAHEEAIVVEHLVSVGRRSAPQRTAHLLCEFGHRLKQLGLAEENAFTCPLSQSLLADTLGLSVVHLNRSLRKLRERGLIRVTNRATHVTDFRGLAKFACFDSEYLN